MIVGDCSVFAIESEITEAVNSLSQKALGFFVIHLCGKAFGVSKPDASMLGCSVEAVGERLARRGRHVIPALTDVVATDIATAYLDVSYRDTARTDYFGLSGQQLVDALQSSGAVWAPDGDAAFDDGSHVLQFDIGSRVRIVAFRNTDVSEDLASTIEEVWMDADLFYGILSSWQTLFALERTSRLKA